MPRPEISICIAATRPAGLARLLESLAQQKLPGQTTVEVVLVDNAPCEPSRAAAAAWRGPGPLRRIEERVRNVALARNRAVDAAQGRWLAFVDDDETVSEHWLAAYLEHARQRECDGLFGPVLPRLESAVNSWLDPGLFYARPRFASGTILGPGSLRSGNALLRATLFQGRRFDPAYGRSGGSDAELFGRMLRSGARFEWCDEAFVLEWIPPERHTPRWLARRAYRGGLVHTRRERAGRTEPGRRELARAVAAGALLAAMLPFAALGGRQSAFRRWLRLCTQVGHVAAHLGREVEEYGVGEEEPQ